MASINVETLNTYGFLCLLLNPLTYVYQLIKKINKYFQLKQKTKAFFECHLNGSECALLEFPFFIVSINLVIQTITKQINLDHHRRTFFVFHDISPGPVSLFLHVYSCSSNFMKHIILLSVICSPHSRCVPYISITRPCGTLPIVTFQMS